MNRDFQLYGLSNDEFEDLVCQVCDKVLGVGTISFSDGPDGGRDARFEGTANKFPSVNSPWSGKFIIQAKKNSSPNASCSNGEFTTVLKKEIPKVKRLFESKELDVYLLFTNRKLSAESEIKILRNIKDETKVDKIALIGKETLSRYLNEHPEIVKSCKLDRFHEPLRFNAEDIKEIIIAFNDSKDKIISKFDSVKSSMHFLEKEKKNQLNKLSKEYFEYMKSNSLSYFNDISQFLKNIRNVEFATKYEQIADELKAKFISRRNEFAEFDEIFGYIYDYVLEAYPELKDKRRLIHVILHYMYWNCDIGINVETK